MCIYFLFRRFCFLLIITFMVVYSSGCFSHVRWFVGEDDDAVSFQWGFEYYAIFLVLLVYSVSIYYIDKYLVYFYGSPFFFNWRFFSQWRFLSVICGLTLVLVSIEKVLLAPNIVDILYEKELIVVQMLCGLVMMAPFRLLFLGSTFFLYCCIVFLSVEFYLVVDYIFEFSSIAAALIFSQYKPNYSIVVLRIGFGAQLMVLAVHNKLMNPSLGLQFLNEYSWNFMSYIGFRGFDDLLFVFSAGMFELAFGLMIALGIGTRLVSICVIFFFVITSIILGVGELVGHLPIIASAVVLFSLSDRRYRLLNDRTHCSEVLCV